MGADGPGAAEPPWLVEPGCVGQRHQRPHAGDRHQAAACRAGPRTLGDLLVELEQLPLEQLDDDRAVPQGVV